MEIVLKRLLAVVVVLLIAAAMAVPAIAQEEPIADINGWGTPPWLINMFGDETGSLAQFCVDASPSAEAWAAIFPALIDECGWVLEESAEETAP